MSVEPPDADLTEFTVVARASSSARFLPEDGYELAFDALPGIPGSGRLRMSTRWVESGLTDPLPRELYVEIRGPAPSIDEALGRFTSIARFIATIAALVANVRVGTLEAHLAYDSTPGHDERLFYETFLPDEIGHVREGRAISPTILAAVVQAVLQMPTNHKRIELGLRQYELALREWSIGSEWLALSHLYMAVEALTVPTLERVLTERQQTPVELASSIGLETDNPRRPRWRHFLEVWVRTDVIFNRDRDTYSAASEASNGLEHGYLELNEIARHAVAAADKTFAYVRRTIFDLLQLPDAIVEQLMSAKPMDVQSTRKILRGSLVNASENPAAEGERYPLVEWASNVTATSRDGATFAVQNQERFIMRVRPGVEFRPERIERVGRLVDGQIPIELDDARIDFVRGHPSTARDLLKAVMELTDSVINFSVDQSLTFPEAMALQHFGQGVAFFQSVQALLHANHPAEAPPLLRGLVTVTAHFEQMAVSSSGGLGVAVRIALDGIEQQLATDDLAADAAIRVELDEQRATMVRATAQAGVEIPMVLDPVEASGMWGLLRHEMWLAENTLAASHVHGNMHVVDRNQPGGISISTRLPEGPISDLVASAAAMAQIELLRLASIVFGWPVDLNHLRELARQALDLNNGAAAAS